MSSIPEHIITRFLQNTISKEEEQALNDWLCASEQNKEMFCRFLEIWDSEKLMSNEAVIQSWEKLCQKLDIETWKEALVDSSKKTVPASGKRVYRIAPWLRYAAAILIGIMTIGVWYIVHQGTTTSQIAQNVTCNQDGVQKQILPDGSVVWINAGSCLSSPKQFNQNVRRVSLDGIAYFEIKKNAAHPFIVKSGNIEVSVTGTEFVVNSASEKDVSIILVSGGVIVDTKNEKGVVVAHVSLAPGQQADVNKHDGQVQVADVDVDYYLTWKDGNYRFTDEPLEKIVRQLSWRFRMDIHITPKLKDRRFTGRVSPKHRIEDVLEMIQTSQSVSCQITPTGIYISEK